MFRLDQSKFEELVLYVCQECASHKHFGATKLNKILFYADFTAYSESGKPITGAEYMRLPEGPAPRCLVPIRDKLVEEGSLEITKRRIGRQFQHRYVALRKPDLDLFSVAEIKIVDAVIRQLRDKSAKQVSDLSHQFVGWQSAKDRETIPYYVAMFQPTHLSKKQIKSLETSIDRAEKLAERALSEQ